MAPTPDGRAQEVRESTDSDSEAAARKLLRDRVREVANHRSGVRAFAGPQAERITVSDLLNDLEADYRLRGIKSLRRTLSHMKALRTHLGDTRAMTVTTDRIRKYTAARLAEGVSKSTVNRETSILTTAFRLAINEDKLVKRPHIPKMQEGDARSGFFEPEQHAAMLKHLPPPIDDMARFAYVCGWRRGEVWSLRWEYVDRSAREVRLPDTKNGEGRTLPIDPDTWAMFDRLWSGRTFKRNGVDGISEFVFHVRGRAISDSHFSRLWEKARSSVGAIVAGRIFHDYRRTAVRNLMRAGVQQSVAMKITGHESDSIFRRYNITSTADTAEALARQVEYLKGLGTGGNVASFRENSDETRTISTNSNEESTS
jgi:integrase